MFLRKKSSFSAKCVNIKSGVKRKRERLWICYESKLKVNTGNIISYIKSIILCGNCRIKSIKKQWLECENNIIFFTIVLIDKAIAFSSKLASILYFLYGLLYLLYIQPKKATSNWNF